MAQRTLRNVLAGGALIAALTLASPSPAHAATASGFAGLWNWLAGSWGERVAVLWMGEGRAQGGRSRGAARGSEKQGPCIDPNGCAGHQTPAAAPSCKGWNDAGGCVDPNG
jgi:hypothetical protein